MPLISDIETVLFACWCGSSPEPGCSCHSWYPGQAGTWRNCYRRLFLTILAAVAIAATGRTAAKVEPAGARLSGSAGVPFRLLVIQVKHEDRTAEPDGVVAVDPGGIAAPVELRVVTQIRHVGIMRPQVVEVADGETGPTAFKRASAVGAGNSQVSSPWLIFRSSWRELVTMRVNPKLPSSTKFGPVDVVAGDG